MPPDIDEKLTSADQTVLEGSNATLKCVAQGLPHPEVGNFGIVYGYIFGRVQFRFIDSISINLLGKKFCNLAGRK